MYARMVKFVLGLDTTWEAERMADITFWKLKSQPGFMRFECLQDYENGEYKWISYWASEKDLSRSFHEVYPWFKEMIGNSFQWEPSVQVFEVYAAKDYSAIYGTGSNG